MPAKSGKGAKQLKGKYATFVGKMTGPKTKSAMAKVLSVGVTGAKQNAPMEYGTFIESAFRRIEKGPNGIRGIAGFSGGMSKTGFNFGLFLHETTNWSPRAPSQKKGPSWNPNATPKFLERGFTDKDQLVMMQRSIGDTYKI
jgi:hypothetical protein